jgi:hypothetical protein
VSWLSDITENVQNFEVEDVDDVFLDITSQLFTGGMRGYKDGKNVDGAFAKALKDITGVTASERAAKKAEEAVQQETRMRYRRYLTELDNKQRQDIDASYAAQGIRATADVQSKRTFGEPNAGSYLGSNDESNFLGL